MLMVPKLEAIVLCECRGITDAAFDKVKLDQLKSLHLGWTCIGDPALFVSSSSVRA